MSKEFVDLIYVCLYCGHITEPYNSKIMKILGNPNCCEIDMVKVERDKIYDIVNVGLVQLKQNMEQEILKDIM